MNLYTDGSAIGANGPAGWAAYIVEQDKMLSGREELATNNEMEMSALLYGLAEVPDGEHVTVHTDSKLVIGWMCMRWKTDKNPKIGEIRHAISMLRASKKLEVGFVRVKGHTGDKYNTMVDAQARLEMHLARAGIF